MIAGQLGDLAERLAPVLLFVVAMSVVVNLSAEAGAFDAVAAWARRRSFGLSVRTAAWCQILLAALVSTIFLSLDTTAVLITPLAIALARRAGVGTGAAAFAVIWIANLGSLLLPVSNLTNLLSATSAVFDGATEYTAAAWRPAAVAIVVALVAATLVYLLGPRPAAVDLPDDRVRPDLRLRVCLGTLAALLPLLASGVPYWASSTAAAVVIAAVSARHDRRTITLGLIPWRSLTLVVVLSILATLAHATGVTARITDHLAPTQSSIGGLLAVAGVGAALSNLINNIPAYLALEVGVDQPAGMLALLIGVNAGSIITPWASLATLLWHDQLRRSGVVMPWRRFVLAGAVLAPVVVVASTLAIAR